MAIRLRIADLNVSTLIFLNCTSQLRGLTIICKCGGAATFTRSDSRLFYSRLIHTAGAFGKRGNLTGLPAIL